MGDMGEVFNAMRELDKERRHRNLENAYAEGSDGWTICHETHWQRVIKGQRLDYWPSRNKWRFMGRNHHGDRRSLDNFIAKREKVCVPITPIPRHGGGE